MATTQTMMNVTQWKDTLKISANEKEPVDAGKNKASAPAATSTNDDHDDDDDIPPLLRASTGTVTRRSALDEGRYPGISYAAIATADTLDIPIDTKFETEQRATGISLKWYSPYSPRSAAMNSSTVVSSPFPVGHYRVTRWTKPTAGKYQRRHGREEFYTAEGKLYHTIEWCWGERVGKEVWYNDTTGEMIRVLPWVVGPLTANGAVGNRRASRIDGVEQCFEGPVHRTMPWANGKYHGLERWVHARTGAVLLERTWHRGVLDGKVVSRLRNGTVTMRLQYALGRMHGDQVYYTKNGEERCVVPVYHGLRHGVEVCADGTQRYWCMSERCTTLSPTNAYEACSSGSPTTF